MTTPTGTISMTDIQTEFGGSNPIGLNEYYAGGAYVPAGTTGVPSSGTISMNNLRGKSKAVPVTVNVTPTSQGEGSWFIISITAPQLLYYTLYWKITNLTNLQTSDFESTSGVIYYDTEFSQYSSDSFRPAQDSSYEGSGTFRITVYSDDLMTQQVGQSSLLTVTDTYSAGSVTISRSSIYRYANLNQAYRASLVQMTTSGLEGATVYYEVYTVTAGQTLTSADIDAPTSLTGTITVPTGGVVALTIRSTEWDGAVDIAVDKNIQVRFRFQNSAGAILGTSANILLYRKPVPSFSFNPTTIREGYSSTLTGSLQYVPYDATSLFWTASGTANPSSDWYLGGSSGEYPWTQQTQTGPITAAIDTLTEANETLTFTWKLNSTSGTGIWAHTLTIESPAMIIAANTSISGVSITNVHSYPTARDFTVQFRNGSGGWNNSNVSPASTITVDAYSMTSNSIAMLNDPGGNAGTHSMQYQITNPNYQTYTTTAANETFTWPVYQLVLSATGTNANGASRSIYAQITSTPVYGTSRSFVIQYSLKAAGAATWGAWTNLPTAVIVGTGATSSGNTLVYGPVTASAQFDLRIRCVLAGQEIRESNYLYNLWLG